MIIATKLSLSLSHKDLYRDISFSIEKGDCCALIGRSGNGKSTLARLLVNPEDYLFDGKLVKDPACTIGFVSQGMEVDTNSPLTVRDYLAQPCITLQADIDHICGLLGEEEGLEERLEEYQSALDAFDAIDGDNFYHILDKKLADAQLDYLSGSLVGKLSGGEFKLVQVLGAMLHAPKLLIMDEPDAFLDFDHLKALRQLINSHKGTILTITHNRYLLNHCFTKIMHLEHYDMQVFGGSYPHYRAALLAGKVETQEQAEKDSEAIARNAALVEERRFIATNSDSAANGRALKARVTFQARLEARQVKPPFLSIERPYFSFAYNEVPVEGNALTVSGLNLGYDTPLLEDVSFEIAPTDKVAILGANGTGKTSLMEAILKNQNPAIVINPDVSVAYLSQRYPEDEQTIYDHFFEAGFASYETIEEHLEEFGFDKERLTAPLSALSGGERHILALAKACTVPSNFLLLDEPTSHLDTYAQIALEEAVAQYSGGVLMISHDFYSIVNGMDYVLILEEKSIRKVRMRTFRKNIYANHFGKDYLEMEQTRQQLEERIELAIHNNDLPRANTLLPQLEGQLNQMDEIEFL